MPNTNRADALLEEARAIVDPADRLKALDELADVLAIAAGRARAHRGAAVLELRAQRPDLAWREIGDLIGVSGERARQLAEEI